MKPGLPELRVVFATSDAEREQVYRFRYEIYVTGLGRQARQADHPRRLLCEDLDADSTLIYATAAGMVVGVARSTVCSPALLATPLATTFSLDRFRRYPTHRLTISSRLMVDPRWRGADVGIRLIAFLYEQYREADRLFDFCHCRPELVPYYVTVGHRRYLTSFHHPEAGPQEPMVLALQDTLHLARVGSPLLPLAAAWPRNDVASGRWLEREFGSCTTAAASHDGRMAGES